MGDCFVGLRGQSVRGGLSSRCAGGHFTWERGWLAELDPKVHAKFRHVRRTGLKGRRARMKSGHAGQKSRCARLGGRNTRLRGHSLVAGGLQVFGEARVGVPIFGGQGVPLRGSPVNLRTGMTSLWRGKRH